MGLLQNIDYEKLGVDIPSWRCKSTENVKVQKN